MGWFDRKTKEFGSSDYVVASNLERGGDVPVANAVLVPDEDILATNNNPPPTAPLPLSGNTAVAPTAPSQQTQKKFETRFPTILASCPHCHAVNGRTRTRTKPNWLTITAVVLLCILFWPLCWLPLVIDSCKLTEHFCKNCGKKVGEIGAFQDCCVNNRN